MVYFDSGKAALIHIEDGEIVGADWIKVVDYEGVEATSMDEDKIFMERLLNGEVPEYENLPVLKVIKENNSMELIRNGESIDKVTMPRLRQAAGVEYKRLIEEMKDVLLGRVEAYNSAIPFSYYKEDINGAFLPDKDSVIKMLYKGMDILEGLNPLHIEVEDITEKVDKPLVRHAIELSLYNGDKLLFSQEYIHADFIPLSSDQRQYNSSNVYMLSTLIAEMKKVDKFYQMQKDGIPIVINFNELFDWPHFYSVSLNNAAMPTMLCESPKPTDLAKSADFLYISVRDIPGDLQRVTFQCNIGVDKATRDCLEPEILKEMQDTVIEGVNVDRIFEEHMLDEIVRFASLQQRFDPAGKRSLQVVGEQIHNTGLFEENSEKKIGLEP